MVNLTKLIPYLLVPPFVFFLNLTGALGQEEQCIVPTVPGYVAGIETWLAPCECDGGSPHAYSISDAVTRGNYTTMWVDSAGLACPPYRWSLGGTGFHFGDVSGPTAAQTNADMDTIELWADETACGSALVTVTDACGEQAAISVREPSNGGWYLVESEQCSHWERDWCCFCYCTDTFEMGAYRYENVWIGDKACQMTEESCGPYPGGEDLRGNACYVVGFYTPAYCNTFYQKRMWEWRCSP